jgi:hypothetical protein
MASPSDNIDFLKDKISLDSNIIIDFFENSYEETIKRVFRKKVYFSIFILREISRYDLSIFDYDELDIKGEEEIEYFVFCKVKFPTFAKLFPQAPVGNIMSTKSKTI